MFSKLKFSSEENYKHNKKALLEIPTTGKIPFSKDDYIECQSLLKNLKYGCKDSAYCGCGWIAVWNCLKFMNVTLCKARVIKEMESGLMLNGMLGTCPTFIKTYLKKLDYYVDMVTNLDKILQLNPDQGIIYYQRKDLSAHYVSFNYVKKNEEGKCLYQFHNAEGKSGAVWKRDKEAGITYIQAPIMTIEEFIATTDSIFRIFYNVRRK